MATARDFIFRHLSQVKGYLDPADALVFLSILEGQEQRNFSGGMAEIGVYYGRSFFLLKKLARPGEKVLGIDLFDIGKGQGGKSKQLRTFLENGRKLQLPVDESLIIVGDSTKLAAADIVAMIGQVRFFSVDGGHMLRHVEADSALARQALADFGVIAFDDSFNPEWPEVTVGIVDFLRANAGRYAPFCITNKKTYVCSNGFFDFYKAVIQRSSHLGSFEIADVEMLGAQAVRVHHPLRRRILYEALVRSGMPALSQRVYA